MSKKVVWNDTPYEPAKKRGTYKSYGEFLDKANRIQAEQQEAIQYLQKARPAMAKLLEIRMTNGEPLKVMRPLRYKTSVMKSELHKANGEPDDLDASFYGGVHAALESEFQKAKDSTFVDVVKTINPGTLLVLKSLDPNMSEFIFRDGAGKEVAIPYESRDALMTQTDVFETVQKLLEGKGE